MFKIVRDYHVPEKDEGCIAVVFDTVRDLTDAINICHKFEVVIQAGGNFGVWANYLSDKFKFVYTFEPDPVNFSCLCRNIGDVQNIIKIQAALGDGPGCVALSGREQNAGAHYIDGVGVIPVLRIDDLGLRACDLIVLDIEGYELKALKGAEQTIRRFKPVIHIEDKGLSERYGTKIGASEEWLKQFGYEVRGRPNRDVILSC